MRAHTPHTVLTDPDAYAASLSDYVVASPSSFHAATAAAARLEAVELTAVDENQPWDEIPRRGYVLRDGALVAWMLPVTPQADTAVRIVGAHTDSPALKLKPAAARTSHGFGLINAEVYGGPLLNSFLDRDLGLAGRLVTRDGQVHLVRTGPIARVAQVAPHLDRTVNDSLHLDCQAHLLPLWTLLDDADGAPAAAISGTTPPAGRRFDDAAARGQRNAVEIYLCEIAGIDPADLAFHDVLTFPTEAPARCGRHEEFFASSRLDNLSSVQAALVALEALATGRPGGDNGEGSMAWDERTARDAVVFIANDHEEVGSLTRSGASGPLLEQVMKRLGYAMGITGDAYEAMVARSVCVSADAGHSIHPNYPQLHDPVVQPLLNRGPLIKINASQRYATDAVGVAVWERACRAAGVPSQHFVSNNAVSCGTTIGPITAARLGMTTVDVGQPLLSMHSQRELCGVEDGPWLAQALAAYWVGA